MDELRGRSKLLSPNTSRELLAHSDLSSVLYMNRMGAQSEDPTWANQTKQELFQLFYASHKEGKNNNSEEAKRNNNMSSIDVEDTNNNRANINLSHGFKSTPLVYSDDQPTN